MDASIVRMGAALYQEQGGQMKVTANAVGVFPRVSPVIQLIFLTLKWAVTETFHDYLYSNQFTDSNPLTYVLTSLKLDCTRYRWLSALSAFSFKLQFKAGKQNMDTDRQTSSGRFDK